MLGLKGNDINIWCMHWGANVCWGERVLWVRGEGREREGR